MPCAICHDPLSKALLTLVSSEKDFDWIIKGFFHVYIGAAFWISAASALCCTNQWREISDHASLRTNGE